MTNKLCEYGCNQSANFQIKNGKWCCSKSPNSCKAIREKNKKSSIGKKHTKETKEKISRKQIGKKKKVRSEEHRKNLSIALTGKKKTEEHKEKIRQSNKGQIRPFMYGELNPNWKGGIEYNLYCDQWKDWEYKESIRERDGHICLNPECSKISSILNIHHIDYNKKNCHPLNLITVCVSCNAKANKDRNWHEDWYTAIIYNRYKRI